MFDVQLIAGPVYAGVAVAFMALWYRSRPQDLRLKPFKTLVVACGSVEAADHRMRAEMARGASSEEVAAVLALERMRGSQY